jgi:hypothetical protein
VHDHTFVLRAQQRRTAFSSTKEYDISLYDLQPAMLQQPELDTAADSFNSFDFPSQIGQAGDVWPANALNAMAGQLSLSPAHFSGFHVTTAQSTHSQMSYDDASQQTKTLDYSAVPAQLFNDPYVIQQQEQPPMEPLTDPLQQQPHIEPFLPLVEPDILGALPDWVSDFVMPGSSTQQQQQPLQQHFSAFQPQQEFPQFAEQHIQQQNFIDPTSLAIQSQLQYFAPTEFAQPIVSWQSAQYHGLQQTAVDQQHQLLQQYDATPQYATTQHYGAVQQYDTMQQYGATQRFEATQGWSQAPANFDRYAWGQPQYHAN